MCKCASWYCVGSPRRSELQELRLQMVVSHWVGARNQTQVLCNSKQLPLTLSHLFSPWDISYFTSLVLWHSVRLQCCIIIHTALHASPSSAYRDFSKSIFFSVPEIAGQSLPPCHVPVTVILFLGLETESRASRILDKRSTSELHPQLLLVLLLLLEIPEGLFPLTDTKIQWRSALWSPSYSSTLFQTVCLLLSDRTCPQ